MLSRAFGAAMAVLLVAGAACAQPELPPPVPLDAPPDGLFPGPSLAEQALGAGDAGYYRWWIGGEYFLGFVKPADLPTVATTGTVGSAGLIGRDGTRSLLGGKQDFDGISGGRFHGGLWLDECRSYGVEWAVFFLPVQRTRVSAAQGSADVIARPFFDTALNTENVRLVSFPGQFEGRTDAEFSTRVWGADVGSTVRVYDSPTLSLEQLFHFRHIALEDTLLVTDTSRGVPGAGVVTFNGVTQPAGAVVGVSDYFSAVNRFYGGAGGVRVNWMPGRWNLSLSGRMAVGAMHQVVTVDGVTTLTGVANPSQTAPGLLTAGQPNGRFTGYKLSLAPDVHARIGYRVTNHITLTAGYQFQYFTNVARAGEQIERNISSTRVPAAPNFGAAGAPADRRYDLRQTDYWLHGFGAGLMITF
jgi:hypothetical protein